MSLPARGLRTHRELGADKPHGSRMRYMSGCRCAECRRANATYERERIAARARGEHNGLVPVGRTAAHLAELSARRIGYKTVARRAKVAASILALIKAGKRTHVRASTERRVLAVKPSSEALPLSARVSAWPTRMRIRELLALGMTKIAIARALGCKSSLQIAGRENVTVKTERAVLELHRKHIATMPRRPFTADEIALLKEQYPHKPTAEISAKLGRSYTAVSQKAMALGLHKTEEFLNSSACARFNGKSGIAHRFQKGHVPLNKGLRRPGWAAGRMKETQFKKGQKPHTWLPIGSERVSKDGILQVKVSDTGYPPRDWKSKHAIVYEQHYGPIPPGHLVVFRDRDRRNFHPTNLECIKRSENMRRNSIYRYPPELVQVIKLRGSVNRVINRRKRDNASKQNHRSQRRAVCNAQRPAQQG